MGIAKGNHWTVFLDTDLRTGCWTHCTMQNSIAPDRDKLSLLTPKTDERDDFMIRTTQVQAI